MNRNVLKILALASMLIDHIGKYLLNNNVIFRIIGRIAFPIFAFFIAEGLKKTHNQKKYILRLCLFALISQIPYMLLNKSISLNVLFTFILAIILIKLIEIFQHDFKQKNYTDNIFTSIFILLYIIIIAVLGYIGIVDYGICGVSLIATFYFISELKKFIWAGIILLLLSLKGLFVNGFSLFGTVQFWSILSIPMLLFYNKQKGKLNLKYLFFIFYPAHLLILWFINVLI